MRYAVLNDVHFPYEGKCFHKALKIIQSWDDLAGIYLNGDILEIESLSRHPKGPQAISSFDYEVKYANQKFDYMCKIFPDVPVTLIEGNHSYRVFRFIRDVAPQLWGLLENPVLLKFPERGWKFVEYGPRQWVRCGKTDLWLRHEPLRGGVNCAQRTAKDLDVSLLFGHTHTYQRACVNKMGPIPRRIEAISGGWLGDRKQSVFDYRGGVDSWVEGFSEVTQLKGGRYEYRFNFL